MVYILAASRKYMPATMLVAVKNQYHKSLKRVKRFTAPQAKNIKAATMENGLNSSRSNHAEIPAVIQPTTENIHAMVATSAGFNQPGNKCNHKYHSRGRAIVNTMMHIALISGMTFPLFRHRPKNPILSRIKPRSSIRKNCTSSHGTSSQVQPRDPGISTSAMRKPPIAPSTNEAFVALLNDSFLLTKELLYVQSLV
jgi:hypothetical protein